MRPRTTLETPADIRRSAMDLLARREHSYAELQRKLRQRGASGDMAEVELDRLVEDGLLSDERFCEAYIYARSQRGYGPARLREEQRAKLAEEARQKKAQIELELKRRKEENERRKMRRKSAQERLAAEKAAKRTAALEAKRAAEEAHRAEQARLKRELSLCLCPHCNPDQCDSAADLATARAKGAARHAAEAAIAAAEAAVIAQRLGIPTISGVANATRDLRHGEVVTLQVRDVKGTTF